MLSRLQAVLGESEEPQYNPDMAYLWRRLDPEKRKELLAWRMIRRHPWHSPPHPFRAGRSSFHISAACFEHAAHIGFSKERMDSFSAALLETSDAGGGEVHAWSILPNHYHLLVRCDDLKMLLQEIGKFHGRTAHAWNGEEETRGRQIFSRTSDRLIRSERHFFATMNYIHNNAVHHGYVKLWKEWPWSSAHAWLESVGR